MRILYIAKHGQTRSNDDEGAILDGFRRLGHAVVISGEETSPKHLRVQGSFDFMLVHRIQPTSEWLVWAKGKFPIVCWYFDKVNSQARKDWVNQIREQADFMFMTDGDYVVTAADLHCFPRLLRQGADERWWDKEVTDGPDMTGKVLMTASLGRGGERLKQVTELRQKLGDRFIHYKHGLYGEAFRRAVSTADLVVAPSWPSTDRYWSNRVYVTLAARGCLLHPLCHDLTRAHGREYRDGRHLFDYLQSDLFGTFNDIERLKLDTRHVAQEGRKHTYENHLYRHRIEQLLKEVF